MFDTWDQYVTDAQRDPIVIKLSETDSVAAQMPTGAQVDRINEATRGGDQDVLLDELFGADGAAKLREVGRVAPAFALGHLVNDVLDAFGMTVPTIAALRAVLGKDPAATPSS